MLALREKKAARERPRDRHGREVPFPHELPDTDEQPMESNFQRQMDDLLSDQLRSNWAEGSHFCAGNVFVHHSLEQVLNKDFLGPDFFVVLDPPYNPKRKCWAVWAEEDRFPDMILEIQSPATRTRDLTTKKAIYERVYRTPDYVCYDPDRDELQGWHLAGGVYVTTPVVDDGIWCESLQLHLRRWRGSYSGKTDIWLRYFDRDGRMLPTLEELRTADRAKAAAAEAFAREQSDLAAAAQEEIRILKEQLARLTAPPGAGGELDPA